MATSKENRSPFEILNAKNVKEHTEKKNGMTYLSWAWAWAEVKKEFPDANYRIYERPDGCFYFTDGRTCWVKTGVTIEGLEHIEYLPVMDYKNKSIPLESITSFDVNKAIQRSLTKACARHGLGLYIYAGEDLPEAAPQGTTAAEAPKNQKKAQAKPAPNPIPEPIPEPTAPGEKCENCGNIIQDAEGATAAKIISETRRQFNHTYCMSCAHKAAKGEIVPLPFPIDQDEPF